MHPVMQNSVFTTSAKMTTTKSTSRGIVFHSGSISTPQPRILRKAETFSKQTFEAITPALQEQWYASLDGG